MSDGKKQVGEMTLEEISYELAGISGAVKFFSTALAEEFRTVTSDSAAESSERLMELSRRLHDMHVHAETDRRVAVKEAAEVSP